MVFCSISFLLFFAVVFLLYWVLPHRFRWILLIAANLFFYGCFDVRYLIALLSSALISYLCARLLEGKSQENGRKIIFVSGLILTLALLVVFKYSDFALTSVTKLLSLISVPVSSPALNLIMPAGISFYTFQMAGYVIDVYKGKITPEKHFGKYLVFVSFFPNISSGPIERAGHFLPQLDIEKTFDYDRAVYGMRLMLVGLLKKVVFADSMSKYVDNVFDHAIDFSGPAFILATILFTFQIYCDFSGYSDMALGAATLLGFDLPINFKQPYFASSIKEFWARWHISLSTWFRDYVYIPLGGNRVSKSRRNFNLIVTFLVSGLWHGANWTFVLWGGIHGVCQVVENTVKEVVKKGHERSGSASEGRVAKADDTKNNGVILKTLKTILTFCIVSFAWMFFRANSISDAIYILKNMFLPGSIGEAFARMSMSSFSIIKTALAIVALMVFDYFSEKRDLLASLSKLKLPVRWIIYVAVTTLVIVLKIHNGTTQEFIYFRF